MGFVRLFLAAFAFIVAIPALDIAPAAAQCRLCSDAEKADNAKDEKTKKELEIVISTGLDFDTLTLTDASGGEATLDPRSGSRRVQGSMEGLGGMWLSGKAELTGEPGSAVRITLPGSVTLSSPSGGTATLDTLETDLPVTPRLDENGNLSFSFGGKLRVSGNATGQFRGRIYITADYD